MLEQRLTHRQDLRQLQRLALTQEMQQAIHILQLGSMELEQYVQQELEVNPALEMVQKNPTEPAMDAAPSREGDDVFDEPLDLDAFATQWDRRHTEGQDLSYNPDAHERAQFYQDSISQPESLAQHLMAQLRVAAKTPAELTIGERIIGDIDGRGYFTGSVDEIAVEMGIAPTEVEATLHRIQQFEPTGIGARTVIECLLLQIDIEYPDEPQLKTLVAQHLEALERRQIPKIAKDMGISTERVEELKSMLAKLNPWPGHEYAQPEPQYITPELVVEKIDDDYIVYLSSERVPELRINDGYLEMSRRKEIAKDDRKFLREKLDAAEWLIRSIEQRQNTILRIGKAIVEVQREFLDRGPEYIKPLTLQEIAEKVGVHESTVSRATRGKYMQTPQGLFELKYFFSPGLRSDSGEAQSSKSVQTLIQKIVSEEDRRKPLSDQQIADLLKKQGIQVARRTVTKYREAMGILSASMRKSY